MTILIKSLRTTRIKCIKGMKKKLLLSTSMTVFAIILSCVVFSACSKDSDPVLYTNTTSVTIEADGTVNTGNVTVTAEHTDYTVTVTSGNSWLRANKNGTAISISADQNTDATSRKGTIQVTSTTNSTLNATIEVTQNGAEPSITVNGTTSSDGTEFPGMFDSGKSGIDYRQTFTVKSNVEWRLSNKPDWLNVSQTSGKGEVELSIYPTSENMSSSSRTASLTLQATSASASATINISQTGYYKVVYVRPENTVALYDRICWEYTATSNVNKFQYIILSEREYNRMTDRELLAELQKTEELKYADDYLSFSAYDSHNNRITYSSTYYIVTVAYDENDNVGEMQKVKVTTPAYLDATNDAWVNFDNATYGSAGFKFETIKEGYCNTYHLIYGLADQVYNHALYAFEINYYLKYKKKHWFADALNMEIVTDYPNNHTFTYTTSNFSRLPVIVAYGWGVFKDGTLSSDLVGMQYDTSSSSAKQMRASRNINTSERGIVKRSDILKAASKKR